MMFRDRIKELRRVPAGRLVPNEKNWREHPKAQRAALKDMLKEVGYANALVAFEIPADPDCLTCDGKGEGCDDCEPRLKLIDGHLRAETSPDQEVPVLVLDVTPEEADKILLTLDPLASLAITSSERLESLLSEVDLSSEAVQQMLLEVRAGGNDPTQVAKPGHTDPDDTPELTENPVTQPGDLWVMGHHRLLCGDATIPSDVQRLLDGAEPFLMVTDPPYGVDYDPEWRVEAAAAGSIAYGATRTGKVENDDRADWSDAWGLFHGEVVYVWHGALHAREVVGNLEDCDFQIRSQIIWRKPHLAISRGHYHWQHESCVYAVRKGKTARWAGDRKQTTVWDIAHVSGDAADATVHGTQKPMECMERPIRNHGQESDYVYDPFLGSGTTLIACERLGRYCLGMDVDPAYCDMAVRRWEAYTGKTAERIPVESLGTTEA